MKGSGARVEKSCIRVSGRHVLPPLPVPNISFKVKPVACRVGMTSSQPSPQFASHIDLGTVNLRLQEENDALKWRVTQLETTVATLEAELSKATLEVVAPREFLPQHFYEANAPIIDAIIDYSLLYRYARRTLTSGSNRPPEGGSTERSSADEYLRARVAALTAENLHMRCLLDRKR